MHVDESSQQEKPLLDWVLGKFPNTPKTRAKQWILAGRVSVGGTVIRKPHQKLSAPGPALQLLDRQSATLECDAAWRIHPRVSIMFLDSAVAIVNKGPGLIAVPAPNCELSALSILADFLAGRLKAPHRGGPTKTLPQAYRRLEPLPVHRLDQYTSGVFCIALNPRARMHLIEQLKAHTMRREYVAFVEGRLSSPKGTWHDWLQLSHDELSQRVVRPSRDKTRSSDIQEAITHYEVIAQYSTAGTGHVVTKLRIQLETGRKHQIRVQAAHAGHPLIGDRTYNSNYRGKSESAKGIAFPRQALHAESLELEHPEQPEKRLRWNAPFPSDLQQLEAALRKLSRSANENVA